MAYEYEGQIVTVDLIENDFSCVNRVKGGRGGDIKYWDIF